MTKIIVDANVFINSFNSESKFREESVSFLERMSELNQNITMPAHGLFEIFCALKRLKEIDKNYSHAEIDGKFNYPIELISIDDDFITKYSSVSVPYTKAGDHLYLVVAKHNGFPLITRDNGLYKRSKEAKVNTFTPNEYIDYINTA